MAHPLDQFAQFILFAGAWALGVGLAMLITVALIAVIEMSADRWRK